jgi:hypothetical protein
VLAGGGIKASVAENQAWRCEADLDTLGQYNVVPSRPSDMAGPHLLADDRPEAFNGTVRVPYVHKSIFNSWTPRKSKWM